MTKLLIFDFDGVIITGSNEGYFTCYHAALDAVGVRLPQGEERQKILDKWGKGYKIQIEYLLQDHSHLVPQALKAYEKCYYSPAFTASISLLQGAQSILHKLSGQYTLAIASGMMRKTLEKYLQEYEISQHFQYVLSSSDIKNPEYKKPSPYMLQVVLKHFHARPESAVYIGDAKGDVEMARNAGVEPIVVLTGHLSEKEAKVLKVKRVVSDITRIEEVL
jgi:phosphoglycolate phosphatase